jgi:hypothetical protein
LTFNVGGKEHGVAVGRLAGRMSPELIKLSHKAYTGEPISQTEIEWPVASVDLPMALTRIAAKVEP